MALQETNTTQHTPPRVFEPLQEPHKSTIIFLHGRGDSGQNIAPFLLYGPITRRVRTALTLRDVLPHTKFLFPTALKRHAAAAGYTMNQWFDIDHLQVTNLGEEGQVEGVKESSDYIHQLIQEEIDAGIPPERILIMGLSQGAATGAIVTLRYPQKLGGFVGMSGWLPFIQQLENVLDDGGDCEAVVKHVERLLGGRETVTQQEVAELRQTPVFIGHGIHDNKILPKSGSRLRNVFQRARFQDVSWAVYEEGHWWCDEEIVDVVRWLAERGMETHGLEELREDTKGSRIMSST
ncbi:hypothetical protein ABW19_dt0206749 [Dactylella cylindrospora]|nr:hypothetical protein ABW19_dt0206749 [Dactylella cylindrospora]